MLMLAEVKCSGQQKCFEVTVSVKSGMITYKQDGYQITEVKADTNYIWNCRNVDCIIKLFPLS